jgi:ribosomal protein L14E/L6E/L27E
VRIAYHGKVVITLAGKEAARFLARVDGVDADQAQMVMAKATGNFKRGNERQPGRA